MGFGKTLIQMLIMSATLAAWEIMGKPLFFQFAESQGWGGFGVLTMAYMVVLVIGYVLARVVTRKKTED